MVSTTMRPNPVEPLRGVRSLLRPAPAGAREHLHFDRASRTWRRHEEREPLVLSTAVAECA